MNRTDLRKKRRKKNTKTKHAHNGHCFRVGARANIVLISKSGSRLSRFPFSHSTEVQQTVREIRITKKKRLSRLSLMIKRIIDVAEIVSKSRRENRFSCQTNLSQVLSLLCFSVSVYALYRLLTTVDVADLYTIFYHFYGSRCAASATYGCLEFELEIRAALGAIGKCIYRMNEINGGRRRRKHSIKQLIYFVGRNTRLIESAEFQKPNKK